MPANSISQRVAAPASRAHPLVVLEGMFSVLLRQLDIDRLGIAGLDECRRIDANAIPLAAVQQALQRLDAGVSAPVCKLGEC